MKNTARNTAWYGVLIALAMILSYVESLVPINFGIPGVKLGLANLVVFVALYQMRPFDAFLISMVRILLVGLTFGNLFAVLYSFSGGVLSFLIMWLCKKKNLLGRIGVSVAGGVFHNLGQLVTAAFVLENAAVFTYFPVLLLSGMITGALIGLLGGIMLQRIPDLNW